MTTLTRALAAFTLVALASACGPSAEEKALKKERVDLMAMQHEALKAGEKECGAAQKRLDEFGKTNKDRIEKFNKAWEALPEEKRKSLLDIEPMNAKEVNDELIALIVSCPGVQKPVSMK